MNDPTFPLAISRQCVSVMKCTTSCFVNCILPVWLYILMFCLLCVKGLFEGLKLTENKMVVSSLPSSLVKTIICEKNLSYQYLILNCIFL